MLDVSKLLTADCYDHPVERIELLETHISWVILTGPYVYKIKKPVNFGFLDFSTLEKRRHYCEEELRLNRRLAPQIYLAVVPLCGTPAQPHFGHDRKIIDYAVKMRQFPQSAQLDRMLQNGTLQTSYLDAIAEKVAHFHQKIEIAAAGSDYGEPNQVWHPVAENFAQIREREIDKDRIKRLDALYHWSRLSFEQLTPSLQRRKQDGFVRECHGDLHLRNMAWFEDTPVIFDCIEFNPQLRWIDVMSDMAFLFMDLIDRSQFRHAYRLLNHYLTVTGDYAGLAVLPFYVVYRAIVRAKVDRIRLSQSDITAAEEIQNRDEYIGYLRLAESFTQRQAPILIITRGLSASGKSTISNVLLETLGAIRLRSDVERKRLAGIDIHSRAAATAGQGIYTPEMSRRTYDYLLQQARTVLQAGFSVIVDAAFLELTQRSRFTQLAAQLGLPFVILQCVASATTLRRRICARQHDVSDADLAILEHQLQHYQSLDDDELAHAISVDTEQTVDFQQLATRIQAYHGE
ncbi:MAG: AAA family ATPase [Gammaproteobacteria bacterium]